MILRGTCLATSVPHHEELDPSNLYTAERRSRNNHLAVSRIFAEPAVHDTRNLRMFPIRLVVRYEIRDQANRDIGLGVHEKQVVAESRLI
jgi:hypothetical protein